MKKVSYIIVTILEFLLLAGTYVVNYYTRRKMGMARYVIYKNQGWEREYSMNLLQNITLAVLVILMLLALALFIKKRKETRKLVYAMNIVMVILVVIYIGFTKGSSTETLRAYYFISALLGVAALLQIIKAFIGTLVFRHES